MEAKILNRRSRNILKRDPTRTLTLRKRFAADVNRRFKRISDAIVKHVGEENSFGLPTANAFCPTGEGGGVDPSCSPSGEATLLEPTKDLARYLALWGQATKMTGANGQQIRDALNASQGCSVYIVEREGKLAAAISTLKDERGITIGHVGSVSPGAGKAAISHVLAQADRERLPVRAEATMEARTFWAKQPGFALKPNSVNVFIRVPTTNASGEAVLHDEVPDIRQTNHYECGLCAARAAAGAFEIGLGIPHAEWKRALGTSLQESTHPERICSYLSNLGLAVEDVYGLGIEDLHDYLRRGFVVICPVQDYSSRREKGATFAYGHYLTVIGFGPGIIIAQDSSIENVEHVPGGDVTDPDPDQNIEAPGRIIVREDDWLRVWHDVGVDGTKYIHYGIAVGPGTLGTPLTNSTLTANARYEFLTSPQKLAAFARWLKQVLGEYLVGEELTDEDQWWDAYIQDAYKKGQGRAFDDTRPVVKAAMLQDQDAVSDFYKGSKDEFLRSSFNHPESKEKIKLLASRTFTDLKGVSGHMSTQISRTLTDGLAQGQNPRTIAKTMSDIVDVSRKRALAISRTEIIRAHAEGQLDAFERLGLEEVGVAVEWEVSGLGVTALGNDSPCSQCAPMEGTVLSIEEAHGMIPMHPNCVTGDTQVLAANSVAVMSAKYTGQVIDILAANGRRLTVTPHHIMLTQRGWSFAIELTQEDYLVDAFLGDDPMSSPEDYLGHPLIGDVFSSLVKMVDPLRVLQTLPMPENFHGDGESINSEIQVVRTQGILGSKFQSSSSSQAVELFLQSGYITSGHSLGLQGKSLLSTFLERAVSAADCLVRSQGVSNILLGRSLTEHQQHSFMNATKGNPADPKDLSDSASGQSQLLVDGISPLSPQISLDNLLRGKLVKVESATPRHVKNLSVFDVSTSETAYVANGIITSNCMCSFTPANVGEDEKEQKRSQKSIMKAFAEAGLEDEAVSKERPHSIFNEAAGYDKPERPDPDEADELLEEIEGQKKQQDLLKRSTWNRLWSWFVGNYDPNEARDERGEWTSGGGSLEAQQFVESFITTSKTTPDMLGAEARQLLKRTVGTEPVEVFRGIGVMRFRVTPEEWNQVKRLKVGDPAPDWLTGRRLDLADKRNFVSYTKSEAVAKRYKEGQVEIVLKGVAPPDKVLADLSNLRKLGKTFAPDTIRYGTREKELIIEDKLPMFVHSIRGR
jgi:hypothetical protein